LSFLNWKPTLNLSILKIRQKIDVYKNVEQRVDGVQFSCIPFVFFLFSLLLYFSATLSCFLMNATTKNNEQPKTRFQPMVPLNDHVTTEERFSTDELEHRRLADIISSTLGTQRLTFDMPIPSISRLSTVRISDQATTVTIARGQTGIHSPTPSTIFQPYSNYSPYSSTPSTAVNSRAPSPTKELDYEDEDDNTPRDDRLNWRLASGFFACFLGGWADGGNICTVVHLCTNWTKSASSARSHWYSYAL
jgi:hypothetical protein